MLQAHNPPQPAELLDKAQAAISRADDEQQPLAARLSELKVALAILSEGASIINQVSDPYRDSFVGDVASAAAMLCPPPERVHPWDSTLATERGFRSVVAFAEALDRLRLGAAAAQGSQAPAAPAAASTGPPDPTLEAAEALWPQIASVFVSMLGAGNRVYGEARPAEAAQARELRAEVRRSKHHNEMFELLREDKYLSWCHRLVLAHCGRASSRPVPVAPPPGCDEAELRRLAARRRWEVTAECWEALRLPESEKYGGLEQAYLIFAREYCGVCMLPDLEKLCGGARERLSSRSWAAAAQALCGITGTIARARAIQPDGEPGRERLQIMSKFLSELGAPQLAAQAIDATALLTGGAPQAELHAIVKVVNEGLLLATELLYEPCKKILSDGINWNQGLIFVRPAAAKGVTDLSAGAAAAGGPLLDPDAARPLAAALLRAMRTAIRLPADSPNVEAAQLAHGLAATLLGAPPTAGSWVEEHAHEVVMLTMLVSKCPGACAVLRCCGMLLSGRLPDHSGPPKMTGKVEGNTNRRRAGRDRTRGAILTHPFWPAACSHVAGALSALCMQHRRDLDTISDLCTFVTAAFSAEQLAKEQTKRIAAELLRRSTAGQRRPTRRAPCPSPIDAAAAAAAAASAAAAAGPAEADRHSGAYPEAPMQLGEHMMAALEAHHTLWCLLAWLGATPRALRGMVDSQVASLFSQLKELELIIPIADRCPQPPKGRLAPSERLCEQARERFHWLIATPSRTACAVPVKNLSECCNPDPTAVAALMSRYAPPSVADLAVLLAGGVMCALLEQRQAKAVRKEAKKKGGKRPHTPAAATQSPAAAQDAQPHEPPAPAPPPTAAGLAEPPAPPAAAQAEQQPPPARSPAKPKPKGKGAKAAGAGQPDPPPPAAPPVQSGGEEAGPGAAPAAEQQADPAPAPAAAPASAAAASAPAPAPAATAAVAAGASAAGAGAAAASAAQQGPPAAGAAQRGRQGGGEQAAPAQRAQAPSRRPAARQTRAARASGRGVRQPSPIMEEAPPPPLEPADPPAAAAAVGAAGVVLAAVAVPAASPTDPAPAPAPEAPARRPRASGRGRAAAAGAAASPDSPVAEETEPPPRPRANGLGQAPTPEPASREPSPAAPAAATEGAPPSRPQAGGRLASGPGPAAREEAPPRPRGAGRSPSPAAPAKGKEAPRVRPEGAARQPSPELEEAPPPATPAPTPKGRAPRATVGRRRTTGAKGPSAAPVSAAPPPAPRGPSPAAPPRKGPAAGSMPPPPPPRARQPPARASSASRARPAAGRARPAAEAPPPPRPSPPPPRASSANRARPAAQKSPKKGKGEGAPRAPSGGRAEPEPAADPAAEAAAPPPGAGAGAEGPSVPLPEAGGEGGAALPAAEQELVSPPATPKLGGKQPRSQPSGTPAAKRAKAGGSQSPPPAASSAAAVQMPPPAGGADSQETELVGSTPSSTTPSPAASLEAGGRAAGSAPTPGAPAGGPACTPLRERPRKEGPPSGEPRPGEKRPRSSDDDGDGKRPSNSLGSPPSPQRPRLEAARERGGRRPRSRSREGGGGEGSASSGRPERRSRERSASAPRPVPGPATQPSAAAEAAPALGEAPATPRVSPCPASDDPTPPPGTARRQPPRTAQRRARGAKGRAPPAEEPPQPAPEAGGGGGVEADTACGAGAGAGAGGEAPPQPAVDAAGGTKSPAPPEHRPEDEAAAGPPPKAAVGWDADGPGRDADGPQPAAPPEEEQGPGSPKKALGWDAGPQPAVPPEEEQGPGSPKKALGWSQASTDPPQEPPGGAGAAAADASWLPSQEVEARAPSKDVPDPSASQGKQAPGGGPSGGKMAVRTPGKSRATGARRPAAAAPVQHGPMDKFVGHSPERRTPGSESNKPTKVAAKPAAKLRQAKLNEPKRKRCSRSPSAVR